MNIVHTCTLISVRHDDESMKNFNSQPHAWQKNVTDCKIGSVWTWLPRVWFLILATIHRAHSLTFGLHPLPPPTQTHRHMVGETHSEDAELVCSLLTPSLAGFPWSGFTCPCTLHIKKIYLTLVCELHWAGHTRSLKQKPDRPRLANTSAYTEEAEHKGVQSLIQAARVLSELKCLNVPA